MGKLFSPLFTLQLIMINMRRDGGLVTRAIGRKFDSKILQDFVIIHRSNESERE